VLAAYLLATGNPFRAMAWPLLVLGLAELALGVGLFARTGPQVASLEEGLGARPAATAAVELARMERVNRSFRAILAVEAAVLLVGLALALAPRAGRPAWAAVGMGLVLEAAALLVFDLFAERRALAYTQWLDELARRAGGG
jgi:hypothetical protein